MAETVVGALRYDFIADTKNLEAGIARTRAETRKLADAVKTSAQSFEGLGQKAATSISAIPADFNKAKNGIDKFVDQVKANSAGVTGDFSNMAAGVSGAVAKIKASLKGDLKALVDIEYGKVKKPVVSKPDKVDLEYSPLKKPVVPKPDKVVLEQTKLKKPSVPKPDVVRLEQTKLVKPSVPKPDKINLEYAPLKKPIIPQPDKVKLDVDVAEAIKGAKSFDELADRASKSAVRISSDFRRASAEIKNALSSASEGLSSVAVPAPVSTTTASKPASGPRNDNASFASAINQWQDWQKSHRLIAEGMSSVGQQAEAMGQKSAKAIGLARHEMINLGRQMSDVTVSLASGQSPFMVLIQQGAQIQDVFTSSKGSLVGFVEQIATAKNAVKILAGGIAAIAYAAYSSQTALEKLSDSAKALGTSRSALREFSRQADILGVDPAKLREDMVGLAQKIREAQIAGGDFADKLKLIGININNFDLSKPGEFARLFQLIAEKVRTGSNELDKLNAIKFLGLSAEFSRVFNEGGDAVRKFADDSVGAVEDSTKPIEEKWRELRTIASNTWKAIADTAIEAVYAIKENVTSIIDAIANAFARFSVQIDKLMAKAKYSYEYAKSFMGGQAPDTNAYNEKMADYNRMSDYLNMPKGVKETSLPTIDVGGTTDLSGLSTAKAKSGGSKSSKTDQLKEYIDNLKEANQLAKNEVDTFSLGNVEKEKFSALIKAENIAKEQGKTLTAQQRAEIENIAASTAKYKDNVDQLKGAQNALNDAMRQFADFTINALEGLVTRSKKLSDVLKDVVKQLSSSALQGALTGQGIFGQLGGLAGSGGQTGGILGMLAKGATSLFSGFFAEGGSIPSGKWGIAGEAGPELVTGPANITPLGKGSNPQITINNYSNSQVDARQMSDGQIIVTVQQMINSGLKRVPNIMAEAQRRSL